jgi:hypothetical protein
MGHALDRFYKGAGAASSGRSMVKRDVLEVSASGLNLVFCDLGKGKIR